MSFALAGPEPTLRITLSLIPWEGRGARIDGRGFTLAAQRHSASENAAVDEWVRIIRVSTLKTLATVRRLALPNLQINVARQQVNQLNAGGTSSEWPTAER